MQLRSGITIFAANLPRSRGLAPPSTRSSRPSRRAQKPSSSCSRVIARDVP